MESRIINRIVGLRSDDPKLPSAYHKPLVIVTQCIPCLRCKLLFIKRRSSKRINEMYARQLPFCMLRVQIHVHISFSESRKMFIK